MNDALTRDDGRALPVSSSIGSIVEWSVAPLIGVALLNAYGSTLPVSLYAAAITAPAMVCLGLSRETSGTALDD